MLVSYFSNGDNSWSASTVSARTIELQNHNEGMRMFAITAAAEYVLQTGNVAAIKKIRRTSWSAQSRADQDVRGMFPPSRMISSSYRRLGLGRSQLKQRKLEICWELSCDGEVRVLLLVEHFETSTTAF